MRATVERVDTIERFRLLEPEWRALEERAPPRLPFHCADWAAAWWTHLHESRWIIRDVLDVRAVRSPTGELLGIAPMMRTFRPGYGPFAGRQLHYFGADANLTEVRGLFAPVGDVTGVYAQLLDHLADCASTWDWMVLGGTPSTPEIASALTARFAHVEPVRVLPTYHLTLPSTWDEFRSKLGRNIKESLRRCYNAPKRDGIHFEFEVVSDRPSIAAALVDFFRLHSMRANSDAAIRHRDVYESPAAKRFLVDVCERFGDRNAFRLFRIRIAGSVVAVRLAFIVGDSLYMYYSGYDPQYGKYSIMTTVVAEVLKYAIAQGFRTVNLSSGNDVSKTRWHPDETTYSDWLVVSPSLRGRAIYEGTRRTRAWLESNSHGRLAGLLSQVTRAHGGGLADQHGAVDEPMRGGAEGDVVRLNE
jgi:CelD/BcsL family acetyltransferase involved in cellulose biosynthesis